MTHAAAMVTHAIIAPTAVTEPMPTKNVPKTARRNSPDANSRPRNTVTSATVAAEYVIIRVA